MSSAPKQTMSNHDENDDGDSLFFTDPTKNNDQRNKDEYSYEQSKDFNADNLLGLNDIGGDESGAEYDMIRSLLYCD